MAGISAIVLLKEIVMFTQGQEDLKKIYLVTISMMDHKMYLLGNVLDALLPLILKLHLSNIIIRPRNVLERTKYSVAICYKAFASRENLDKHLKHANNVQCYSAHYNKEYLSAHGSTLFMDIEYNDAMNPTMFGNSIHVRQQESYPHMSEYARANVNIDLSNLNIFHDEMESDVNMIIDDGSTSMLDLGTTQDDSHLLDNANIPSDTSMIERKTKIDKIRSITSYEGDFTAALELEEILHKSGASLGLFDSVMSWARKNHDHIPTRSEIYSRKKLYEASKAKLYGTVSKSKGNDEMFVTSNEPKLIHCKLPSKRSVTVPIYSFKEHVCSLLSNKMIVTKENLIYSNVNGNPFHVDTYNDGFFGDVHQTQWWDDTTRLVRKDPAK